MYKQITKRLISVVLVLAMCLSLTVPAMAVAPAAGETELPGVLIEKVDDSAVSAQLPVAFEQAEQVSEQPQFADTDMVRVSIVLEEPSTMEVARKKGVALEEIASDRASVAYRASLKARQEAVAASISRQVLGGQTLDVVWNLTLTANIISANVPYGKLEAIRQVAGVKDAALETRYEVMETERGSSAEPFMASATTQTGTDLVWAAGLTGAGTRIAVLDTGTDLKHQSFDYRGYEYALEKLGLNKDDLGLLDAAEIAQKLPQLNASERMSGVTAAQLYVSSKLPFIFNYASKNLSVEHDDGISEHGSHVAGITCANSYIRNSDGTFTPALDKVGTQGVAPEAQLLTMKVFGPDGGAYDGDYMAAIEDAIILGCDAINLSLGSPSPGFSRNYYFQSLLDSLVQKDSVVVIAAGNSGHWADRTTPGALYADGVGMQTHGLPGSYTNSLAVASVDNAGRVANYFTAQGKKVFYTESAYSNQAFTTLAGKDYGFVYLDNIAVDGSGNNLLEPYKDVINGKIVFIQRGASTFPDKANAAVALGAAAVVVCDTADTGVISMNLTGYEYTRPCVSISKADAAAIRSASQEVSHSSGAYYTGTLRVSESPEAVIVDLSQQTISSFSSWGVPGSLELKPEISAPGGNIYSVDGRPGSGHVGYELMSGTSMASPHMAGMAALMGQYIRENGLAAQTNRSSRTLTQSLLMSTAIPMKDASGRYYPVVRQGAGLGNVAAAMQADSYILMHEDATASYMDGKVKVELGDDPDKVGSYTFGFTLYNLTDKPHSYALSADLFTQALSSDKVYLAKETASLDFTAVWKVDGKVLTAGDVDLTGFDFDGNGTVDADDAQRLMDYVVDNTVKLAANTRPDVDGDGKVTSYDVYTLLNRLSSPTGTVLLPGDGQVDVDVTLTLTEEQKKTLNADYPSGAYLQGFLFVTGEADDEGAEGTAHSIPLLGFYGNWTDPSMFDVASIYDADYGQRKSYVTNGSTNYMVLTYAGDSTGYIYYGNPVVPDAVFMPERNALATARGDKFTLWKFTSIRNAGALRAVITDGTSNYWYAGQRGEIDCAYYYVNGGRWTATQYQLNVDLTDYSALPEDTQLYFNMSLAPEYYLDSDWYAKDWKALGKGATRTVPFTVDNTNPELDASTAVYDEATNTLSFTVSDNQYVAAVVLYNSDGTKRLAYTGSDPNATRGQGSTFTLELPEGTIGRRFQVQVYDYAMNKATYTVTVNVGADPAKIPQALAFDGSWLGFNRDASSVTTYAKATRTFCAATLVGSYALAVDSKNALCVLPLIDMSDATVIDFLPEAMIAMAYDSKNDQVYALAEDGQALYVVDKYNGYCWQTAALEDFTAESLTCDEDGTFYCTAGSTVYTFTMDTLTPVELAKLPVTADTVSLSYDGERNTLCFLADGQLGICTPDGKTQVLGKVSENTAASCLLVTQPAPDTDWTDPVDYVTGLTVGPENAKVIIGGTTRLTAYVKPWNTSNAAVTWSSGNTGVATVNSLTGVVTGVAKGTAFITATSQMNPSKSWSVKVTVTDTGGTVLGVMTENNQASLYSWVMEDGRTWEKGVDLGLSRVSAASLDGKENKLYAMDTRAMYQVDPDTGEVTREYAGQLTMDSFATSKTYRFANGEPLLYGVQGKHLYVAKDPSQLDNSSIGVDFDFGRLGGSVDFMAVATMGTTKIMSQKYGSIEAELFITLNKSGQLQVFAYSQKYGETNFLSQGGIDYYSDLAVSFPNFHRSAYTSMVYAPDGSLYVSFSSQFFDTTGQKTTYIYRLSLNAAQKTARATLQGTVNGCSPAPIYAVSYDTTPTAVERPVTACSASPARPASSGWETENQSALQLTVTAKDAASYSGKITVTYDPDVFVLDGKVTSPAGVFAANTRTDGVVVLGYAGLSQIGQGETVAQLTLLRKDGATQASTVTVSHQERDGNLACTEVEEIPVDAIVHEHSWGKADYQWSEDHTACTASRTCYTCGETETAKAEVTVDTTPAACGKAGKTVYTAVFAESWAEKQVYEETIPALEHEWGKADYQWSEDHTACTASRTCTLCNETETARAEVTVDTTPAVCGKAGKTVYTAVFAESWAEKQVYEETIPALEHQWSKVDYQWSEDHTACTASRTCTLCGEKELDNATVTSRITTEPTFTEMGKTTYTAVFTASWAETQTLVLTDVKVLTRFTDVAEGRYYYSPVYWAAARGITTGMTATEFWPEASCTRGQVVTFLWRAAGKPEPKNIDSGFPDVPTDKFFSKAVAWAVENGITTGMSNGLFEPGATVTRAQFVTFLWRAMGEPKPQNTNTGFTDVESGKFYTEAVAWAVENGITTGMTKTTFEPQGVCIRGQVVTFLYRAYKDVK